MTGRESNAVFFYRATIHRGPSADGVFAYNRQPMQVDTVEPGDVVETIALINRAASVLAEGGLVVFPTETVYGVGACVNSDAA